MKLIGTAKTLATASVILLALGGLLFAAPASAATPVPSPSDQKILTYTGTAAVAVASDPGTTIYSSSSVATIDCSGAHCTIPSISIDGSVHGTGIQQMNGGKSPVLDHGKGRYALSAYNTICSDDEYLPAGTFTVTITGATFAGVYDADAQPDIQCPQADRGQPATIYTFAMTLTSGTACLIDDSCPKPTVAAAAAGGQKTVPVQHHRAANVPSILSALPSIVTAVTVRNALWGAAAAVILVLLIAFPTYFFNEAASKTNELFEGWWKKRRANKTVERASTAAGRAVRAVELAGWPAAAGGVVLASIISAFIDPSFGFDAASLRSFVSILVSFIVDVVIGWFALVLIVRKTHPNSTAKFEFKPLTLLIVIAAVIFTRLTHFQPGIVFGLVAGVVFGGLLATADKARVALIGVGYSFGIGIVAWVGYSLLLAGQGDHPGAVIVFVRETLSGIAIAGASSLPIALLPVRGLTGAALWNWKKWVWGLAYAVGLFAFFVMLMPMPFAWKSIPINLIVWIICYLAYAVVAVGIWLLVARPWKKQVVTP